MQQNAPLFEKSARIKALRTALNMTQSEFAALMMGSKQFVANLESGERSLTEKNEALLALKVPKVNLDWLRTGVGEMFREDVDFAGKEKSELSNEKTALVKELEEELDRLRAQLGEKDKTISNLSNAIEALSEALKKIK